jgi:syntaxin-binding protein 1
MPLQDGKYMYKGGAKPKPMLIDEEDHIWVKCRHMHIADVMKYTAEALNKLKEENPELVKLQQAKSSGVQVDTTELRDAIRSLPQYQAQQERISLHLDIVSELNRIYRGSGLEVLNEIEQTLATGERSSKEKASAKDLWKDVQAVLKAAGGQYDTATKTRMALMYAAVAPEKSKDILAACPAVSDAQVRALDSFNAKDRLAANRKPMGTYSYATMRYDPAVKAIVNGLLDGTLDTKQFPYTDPSAASSVAAATTKAVATTRKGAASRFQSAFTPGAGASAAPAGAGGTLQVGKNETIALTNPARIFVFVVGGMTQSERRAIYELARKCNREIIIGSTSELTPPKYLDGLAGM